MDIRGFRLTEVPDDFFDDPYRYYAALRERDPLQIEFGPKFGDPERDRRFRFRGLRKLPVQAGV